MGRFSRSGRSRSYSPRRSLTPPPSSRRRYDDPRDRRYDDFRDRRSNPQRRRSPAPSGLLVRNISLDSRPEDLRIPFERFGPVKDVYLPKNYYTGEPRGFGFVKFRNAEDAAEAKHQLNHCVIGGREIAIVYAEENRKTPREMRTTSQTSGRHGGGSGRRSPPRFSRRRSYSRSVSPARREFSDRDHKPRDHFLPSRSRSISRSRSPHDARTLKSRHYSRSPGRNGRGLMDPRDGNPRFQESKRSPHDKRATGDWKSAVANEGPSSRSLSPSPPYQSGTHTRS
ncbi:serine/arginine-rich SC35-like splicing factor SCL28 [Cynara cardunculus var. scolymus]|uniref:serine/arginine-rich SC35-like splicing factor SCL28 n=1 Tax=Cynara cardunculus var. scolymus TaxID=59895 RepID=UPI000D62EB37|nr:serine/arginine-rich SC35-like splicing factor SCL28 [Cynara cardunculus var. scolymus]